jgi:hypothetical protein
MALTRAKLTVGTLVLKGGTYTGEILEDDYNSTIKLRHGRGTMNYVNGDKYTGEWTRDAFDGHGEYVWSDGRRFQGQYKDDKMHGHGEVTWPDGRKYVGGYHMDMIHGHGTVSLPDGRAFEGEFKLDYPVEGQMMETDGETSHASFDGTTYVSEWKPLRKARVGTFETGWPGVDSTRSLREFVWNDGHRFAGSCKGYCPLVGVITDVNGDQYAVLYAGNALFSEDPVPLCKLQLKTQVSVPLLGSRFQEAFLMS